MIAGRSGTRWRLRDSAAEVLDTLCLAADILEREQERTGRTPAETWATISATGFRATRERNAFLRRYLHEIAVALYAPETPTDVQPDDDLSFDVMIGGVLSFFPLLAAASGASPLGAMTEPIPPPPTG